MAKKMHAIFETVPCHKFVELAYQVASRLSTDSTPFQRTLHMLLTRLALSHPHHVLIYLMAMKGDAPISADPRGLTNKQAATRALLQVSDFVFKINSFSKRYFDPVKMKCYHSNSKLISG